MKEGTVHVQVLVRYTISDFCREVDVQGGPGDFPVTLDALVRSATQEDPIASLADDPRGEILSVIQVERPTPITPTTKTPDPAPVKIRKLTRSEQDREEILARIRRAGGV